MQVKLSTDFLSGLFFATLGAAALYISWRYPAGTAARMGPGYFPHMVASLLILLGGVLVVRSLFKPGETVAEIDLRPLLFVLLATLSFWILIEHAGYLIASAAVIVLARFARPDYRPLEVAVLAIGLSAISAFLFSYLLGMNYRLFPW